MRRRNRDAHLLYPRDPCSCEQGKDPYDDSRLIQKTFAILLLANEKLTCPFPPLRIADARGEEWNKISVE